MSSPDTWMPFFVGRYLADTGHLTACEHGAYLLALMHYWCNGPLPDDDKQLSAICRTERQAWKKVVGPAIRPFFKLIDGRLHQKRMDIELARAKEISDKKRAAAATRWDKKPDPPDASRRDAYASPRASANGSPPASQVHMPPPVPSPSKNLDSSVKNDAREDRADPSEISRIAAETIAALKAKPPPFTPGTTYQRAALGVDEASPRPKTAYFTRDQLVVARRQQIRAAS